VSEDLMKQLTAARERYRWSKSRVTIA